MPFLRNRLVLFTMRKKSWTHGSVSHNDITLDNYIVHLLREEEMIEAIQMVDPERATEMSRELEEILQEPWSYIDEFNEISEEERLESFQKLKAAAEGIEEVDNKDPHEDEVPKKATQPQLSSKNSGNRNNSRKSTTATPIKKKRLPRPKSHNGEYTWSRKLYHIKQQPKYKAKDKEVAAGKPFINIVRYGISKTPENQFYEINVARKKEGSLRRIPEELAYRPLDAARIFSGLSEDGLLRMAAQRIRIIITQH